MYKLLQYQEFILVRNYKLHLVVDIVLLMNVLEKFLNNMELNVRILYKNKIRIKNCKCVLDGNVSIYMRVSNIKILRKNVSAILKIKFLKIEGQKKSKLT